MRKNNLTKTSHFQLTCESLKTLSVSNKCFVFDDKKYDLKNTKNKNENNKVFCQQKIILKI